MMDENEKAGTFLVAGFFIWGDGLVS